VHSRSSLPPLSRWPRDAAHAGVARKLSDWRFVVVEASDANASPEPTEPARAATQKKETPR
jgi:hypothetical protein